MEKVQMIGLDLRVAVLGDWRRKVSGSWAFTLKFSLFQVIK